MDPSWMPLPNIASQRLIGSPAGGASSNARFSSSLRVRRSSGRFASSASGSVVHSSVSAGCSSFSASRRARRSSRDSSLKRENRGFSGTSSSFDPPNQRRFFSAGFASDSGFCWASWPDCLFSRVWRRLRFLASCRSHAPCGRSKYQSWVSSGGDSNTSSRRSPSLSIGIRLAQPPSQAALPESHFTGD